MPGNPEPNVGSRLRSMREQQRLSLRALAERCGLSINAISQIERGENSPTVASLHRLATALGVHITDLFQEETKQTVILVKQNRGLRSQSNGVLMESLGIGLFNQQMEPFRMSIQPGCSNMQDLISHPGEEFVHCLQGKIEYSIGDQVLVLEQGDSLLFDATQRHGYHNPTSQEAVVLMVFLAFEEHQLARQLHLTS
jgi:transcriptional regulator with XRE-family HTH domain